MELTAAPVQGPLCLALLHRRKTVALGGGATEVTETAGGEADIELPGLWTLRFLLSITLGWSLAWLLP